MLLERIPLRDDNAGVYLQAYWLEPSPEFQTGKQRPVVIVCPGGGYRGASDREAEPMVWVDLALAWLRLRASR